MGKYPYPGFYPHRPPLHSRVGAFIYNIKGDGGRGFSEENGGEGEGTGESPPVYSKSAGTRLERPPPEALRLPSPLHRKVFTAGEGGGGAGRRIPPKLPLLKRGGGKPIPVPSGNGTGGGSEATRRFSFGGMHPFFKGRFGTSHAHLVREGCPPPRGSATEAERHPPFGSGAREVPLLAARKHPAKRFPTSPVLSPVTFGEAGRETPPPFFSL